MRGTFLVCTQQYLTIHSHWITVYIPRVNILLRWTLFVTPLRNLSVNKRLWNFGWIQCLQNLHLCAQKSVCATNLGPFGEIGANFSIQLSSRTRFDKINKKKVIAENQCEKHIKSSLVQLIDPCLVKQRIPWVLSTDSCWEAINPP